MRESTLSLLTLSLVAGLLLLLVMVLVFLLVRMQRDHSSLQRILLLEQRVENQSLRNQLRAQTVPELLGLNHATLPENVTSSNSQGSDPIDITATDIEAALSLDEDLAKQGYYQGDVSGFEASGWPQPIIKRTDGGDPVAFDPTL